MKALEIYFWNCIFWAFYLPLSILLKLITDKGTILGVLLIGVLYTLLFTMFLLFQKSWLFYERMEPAIIVQTPQPKKKKTPKPQPKPMPAPETIKPMEVKIHAKKEKTESPPSRHFVGLEPEPKMETDVDLSMLDVHADDLLG